MTHSNYKKYSDLTIDELEVVVQDIERPNNWKEHAKTNGFGRGKELRFGLFDWPNKNQMNAAINGEQSSQAIAHMVGIVSHNIQKQTDSY